MPQIKGEVRKRLYGQIIKADYDSSLITSLAFDYFFTEQKRTYLDLRLKKK